MNIHTEQTGVADERMAAEHIISRYPEVTEEELRATLHYLRKVASAMDCALISSNLDLQRQYRQLCRDHYLDRLRPRELAIVVLAVIVFAALLFTAGMMLG